MNKFDILRKSREENKYQDEREKNIRLRSYAVATAIGGTICMVFKIVEEEVFNRSGDHLWVIYGGMMFSKYLIDAIKLKKVSDVIISIGWGLLFILSILSYVTDNVFG